MYIINSLYLKGSGEQVEFADICAVINHGNNDPVPNVISACTREA